MGQIELRRAQFTTLSSDASKIPSSFRKFASCPGASSVTPFASSIAIFSIGPQRQAHAQRAIPLIPYLQQQFAP
jgi:hypothetical protein